MAAGFVGREAELALLDDIYMRAKREERPAAALITGLPGSGKTRLLAEFRRRNGAPQQLNVGGYQTGAQVPLAAAGDLLRTLVKVPGAGRKLEEALFGATTSDKRPLEPLRIFEAAHRALLGLRPGRLGRNSLPRLRGRPGWWAKLNRPLTNRPGRARLNLVR